MRKYALVVFDKNDTIIDRFNLDVITNPTDNGFELEISVISSDVEEIITKVVQKKKPIKFTVHQYQNSYLKSNVLANWIQKYSTPQYKMGLEYNDGMLIRYCEGKVVSLTKTELDEYKDLAQDLQFKMSTPYFIKRENTITIQVSSIGKSYPYKYPYSYGSQIIENNEINNNYILDIPLIITIHGAIDNPTIDLLDEDGESYNRVKFDDITIAENEYLVINSAQRKIYKVNESTGVETDFVSEVSPEFDTYLRAKTGITRININTADSGENFKLTGGWRQYTL